MLLYAVVDRQRIGPINEAKISELIVCGKINKDTLTWKTGMENWEPAGKTVPFLFPALPPPELRESNPPPLPEPYLTDQRSWQPPVASLENLSSSKQESQSRPSTPDGSKKIQARSFLYCRGCGKQIHETAPFCPQCGAPQGLVNPPPQSTVNIPYQGMRTQMPAMSKSKEVLSEKWKQRFAVVESYTGGELFSNTAYFKSLSYGERLKIVNRNINWWAFFFSTLYYLYLGMWRRAITYTVVATLINIIIEMITGKPGGAFLASFLFASYANIHYYRKIVLNDDGWI